MVYSTLMHIETYKKGVLQTIMQVFNFWQWILIGNNEGW
jgi:hypothetical protein